MDNEHLKALFSQMYIGDTEAFAAFYDAYKTPVYTVLWRTVGSRELAEDLTQELFVRLYAEPLSPSVQNIRAYIFQMARNLALNALRAQRTESLEDVQAGAADVFPNIDRRLDVDAALGKLDVAQRQVVALHLNGGLTFREIATVTGQSIPGVYRTYRRALKTMEKDLDGGYL